MTKGEYNKILKEYDSTDNQIEELWNSKPEDDLDEERLKKAAEETEH